MAFMIPSTITTVPGNTPGERRLFSILERMLSDQCLVRYEVLLGERDYRPDFTIIDPTRGVLIIEVKDWGVEKITEANEHQFYIRGYRGSSVAKPQLNPDKKCQVYLRGVREQIVSMPILLDASQRLMVPVEYRIAFSNITKEKFVDKKLNEYIPLGKVFFQNDLKKNGFNFKNQYESLFPTLSQELSKEQVVSISAALYPDITIASNLTSGFYKKQNKEIVHKEKIFDKTFNLSIEQEQIAKSLGEGPRLLRGIAGSGKTLIILYRAKMLAANNENNCRILILCWNIALANYMRQAYDKLKIRADQDRVKIDHFVNFVRSLSSRESIDSDYLDTPESLDFLNSIPINDSQKYDAIYIDEAQDFRQEWITFLFDKLFKEADPQKRNLLIAADDAQHIYNRAEFNTEVTDKSPRLYQDKNLRWSKLGFSMRGRSKILNMVYRNSARVWSFAAFLLQEQASYVKETAMAVHFSSKGGFDPQLIECKNLKHQVNHAVSIINKMINTNYSAQNVLILYRHKNFKMYPLIEYLQAQLRKNHIPNEWISEGSQSKNYFRWENDTVKISTVQSAKGMDSPVVIVLGAETFVQDMFPDQNTDEKKLMYVALTRAREFLVVLHTGQGGVVRDLLRCKKDYERYRDAIISRFE